MIMTDSFFKKLQTPFIANMVRNELTCPKCKNPISPPIFHCDKGHSFCNLCYKSGHDCTLCGSTCSGGRTHHLERIVELYTYSCKYFDKGCRTKCKIQKLRAHEEGCQTFEISCPFFDTECTNIGNRQQIVFHCQLAHTTRTFVGKGILKFCMTDPFIESIVQIQNKISRSRRRKKKIFVSFYMLYVEDVIFKVVCKFELEHVKVAIYRISSPSETDDRYECITFFHNDDKTPMAIMTNECVTIGGNPYNPLFDKTYVNIDVEVVKSCRYCSVQFVAKN